MDKVCQFLNSAKCLSTTELKRISDALLKMLRMTRGVEGGSAQRAEKCRKCGATHIVKFGKDKNSKQRYKCKSCGVTFTDTSYSAFSYTRHAEDIWETFIYLTLKGASLAECAFRCDISVRTSFIWRHKILAVLRNDQNDRILGGIIEADEKYYPVSYKGNHKKSKRFVMPRKAFRRGTDNRSNNVPKACVMCAVERNGQSYGEVLGAGQANTKKLSYAFDKRVAPDTIMLTDGGGAMMGYFGKKKTVELIVLKSSKSGKHTGGDPEIRGIYHIQTVNNFHTRLDSFLRRYNGVSTKYLNHYVSLFVWIENSKKLERSLEESTKTIILKESTYMTAGKLFELPPVPKVA